MKKCLVLFVAVVAILLSDTQVRAAPKPRGTELRVYHIGNSVTDTIHYKSLQQMARDNGDTYVFGRHMIPGAPLQFIWDRPTTGFKENPFGYYPTALKDYQWDVITLQPFDRQLDSRDGFGDLPHAKKFIDLALPKSPDVQVYVYQRWPRRKEKEKKNPSAGYEDFDYEKQWLRKYNAGKWDGSNETRDYFERLTRALRAAYPDMEHPVLMVPVGDVLLELDKRAKAGKVPGLEGVEEFYADGIHFNNVGAFVVGTTFYSTMFRRDPRGSDAGPYGRGKSDKDREITREFAKAVQEVVWDVVSDHPLSGVKAGEATTATEKPEPEKPSPARGKAPAAKRRAPGGRASQPGAR